MEGWDQRGQEGFVKLEVRALLFAGLGALAGLVAGVAVVFWMTA